jgi:hypothetical protein
VVLGAIGIAAGMALASVTAFEGRRGELAGRLRRAFGLVYMVWGIATVAGVFAAATISTMLVIVLVLTFALDHLPPGRLERYSHAMAGAVMLMRGIAIRLGL